MASTDDVKMREAGKSTVAIKLSELANHIDIDGDGDIDEDERRILDTLKEMDIDGDGNISLKELVNLGKQLNIAEEQRKTYKRMIFLILFFAIAAIAATFLACLGAVEAAKDSRPDDSGTMMTTTVTGKSKVVQTQKHVETVKITDLHKVTYATLEGVRRMGFQVGTAFYSYTVTGFQQDLRSDGTSAVRFYTSRGDTIYVTPTASTLELKSGGTVDLSAAATLSRHLLQNAPPVGGAGVETGIEYQPDNATLTAQYAALKSGGLTPPPSQGANAMMKIGVACHALDATAHPEMDDDGKLTCACNAGFKGDLVVTATGDDFVVAGSCAMVPQPAGSSCHMVQGWKSDPGRDEEMPSKGVHCDCPGGFKTVGSPSGHVEWDYDLMAWNGTCAPRDDIPIAYKNMKFELKKIHEETIDGLSQAHYYLSCPPGTQDGWANFEEMMDETGAPTGAFKWSSHPCVAFPCPSTYTNVFTAPGMEPTPSFVELTRVESASGPPTCKCPSTSVGMGAKWDESAPYPWVPVDPKKGQWDDPCTAKTMCPFMSVYNQTSGACDCDDWFSGPGYNVYNASAHEWKGPGCAQASCGPNAFSTVSGTAPPVCSCVGGYDSDVGFAWDKAKRSVRQNCKPVTCGSDQYPQMKLNPGPPPQTFTTECLCVNATKSVVPTWNATASKIQYVCQ